MKLIKCLSHRDNKCQNNKPISLFKQNFLYRRRKKFVKSSIIKALRKHNYTMAVISLRINNRLMKPVLELIWMIREGRDIYKFLDKHYAKK